MEKAIRTEYEGKFEMTPIDNLTDFLHNMAEIAINPQDFVQKVAYGVTDETNGLQFEDEATLLEWYHNRSL